MTLAARTRLGPYEILSTFGAGGKGRSGVMLLALLLLAAPALAQFGGESVGHLYGKVVDEQGAVLPGVTVTLSGVGAPATAMTNSGGEFRFLNLAPGTYTVKLELPSFATVNRENVVVKLGRNTEITETLKLAPVAATVTVTGQAPLIDTKNVQTGAVITQTELQSIPTARDPWAILQNVPGVTLDRVNVAGSESGQQSSFVSKGSVAGWFVVDGINVTNMEGVLGGSQIFFDFDTFQEVQVITGGSDPTIQGPGAHINMTTKRGTNQVHGSARIYDVSDSFESTNYPPTDGRRSVQSLQDYGIETGGPIIQDHLWLWGAYGRTQLNIAVGSSLPPLTTNATLENLNGKVDWQVVPANAFELVGQHSNKLVDGRGAGPLRPQATTWDQTLPQNIWKFQDSQVAGANLFFSAMYAGLNGTFDLTPKGHGQLFYDGRVGFLGTAPYFIAERWQQRQAKGDATYFFSTGSLGHELKAGFQYLKAGSVFTSGAPGYAIAGDPNECLKCGAFLNTYPVPAAGIFRDGSSAVEAKYYGTFFSDTLTLDRLTVQVGARWDEQYGTNLPSFAPANPSYPDILPAINYPGGSRPFTWKNWTPRIGITYVLGAKHDTVVKASYAQFVDALGTATVALTNPVGSSAGAYYPWTDTDHNGIVDVGEVCTTCPLVNNYGYNPASAGNTGTPSNLVNPHLKPGKTNEFLVGVDKEILPGLAAGITYTYRKYTLPIYGLPYDVATGTILNRADYVQYGVLTPGSPLCTTSLGTNQPCPSLPGVGTYRVPVYNISPAVLATLSGYPSGFYYTNQTNYNQTYSGVDLSVTKRLSDKWMMRANFTYAANKQNVGANGCSGDPNNGNAYRPPYGFTGATCRDGDYVSSQSTGSGSHYSVFLNSKYVYNLNTMYQLPFNFNFAAAFFGRQGYPINYYVKTTGPHDGRTRAIAVTPTDAFRYPSLYEFDLRLEKVIRFDNTAAVTVAVDAFNITNRATTLQEENNISAINARQVFEVQNPRIFRFGARISF